MSTLGSQVSSILNQLSNESIDKISLENAIKSFDLLIGKHKESQISSAFRDSVTKWIDNNNNKQDISSKIVENYLKFIHQSTLFKKLKLNEFIEYIKWSESDDRLRGELAINILCSMEGYSYFKNFENALEFLSQFDYFKLSITTVDKVNKFLEILLEEDSNYINIEYIPMIENIVSRIYSSNISVLKPSPRIFNFLLNLSKISVNEIENHKKFIPMLRSLLAILAIKSPVFSKLNKFIYRLIHIICEIPLSNYSFEKKQSIFKNHYSSMIPYIFEHFSNCKDDIYKLKYLFGEVVEAFSYQHLLTLIQSNRFDKVTLNIIQSLLPGPTLEKNIISIFNSIVCFINCDILRDDAYKLLEHHMPNFTRYLPELHSMVLPLIYKQQKNFPITTFKTYFKSHELLTLSQFPVLFKNLSKTRIDIINHTLLTHNKEIIETHYENFIPMLLEVLLDPSIERPYYVIPSIGSSIQAVGRNEFFDKAVLTISNFLFSMRVMKLDNYDYSQIGEIVMGLFKIYKAYQKEYVNLWNLGINTFIHYLNNTQGTMYLIPFAKQILEKYPIDSMPHGKQMEEKILMNFEIILNVNSNSKNYKETEEHYSRLFIKLSTVKFFNFIINYNLKPPSTPQSNSSATTLQKSQSINSFSNSANASLHKSQSITLIQSSNPSSNLTKSSSLSSAQSLKSFTQAPYVPHKFDYKKFISYLKEINLKFKNHSINVSILEIFTNLLREFGKIKAIEILSLVEITELIKFYNLNNSINLLQPKDNQLFSIETIGKDIKVLFQQLGSESKSFILHYSKSFIREMVINQNDQSTDDQLISNTRFRHIKQFFDFVIPLNGDSINNYLMESLIIYDKFKKEPNTLLMKLIMYLIEDESNFPLSVTNLDYLVSLKNIEIVEKIWSVYGIEILKKSKYFDQYYELVTIGEKENFQLNSSNNGMNTPTRIGPLSPRPSDNRDLALESSVPKINVVEKLVVSPPPQSSTNAASSSKPPSKSPILISSAPATSLTSELAQDNGKEVYERSTKTIITKTTVTKTSSDSSGATSSSVTTTTNEEVVHSPSTASFASKMNKFINEPHKTTLTKTTTTTSKVNDEPSKTSSITSTQSNTSKPLNEQIYKPTLISPNISSPVQLKPTPSISSTAVTSSKAPLTPPSVVSSSSIQMNSPSLLLPLPSPPITTLIRETNSSSKSRQIIKLKRAGELENESIPTIKIGPTPGTAGLSTKPCPQLNEKFYSIIIGYYMNDPFISIQNKIETLSTVSKEFYEILANEISNTKNICHLIKRKPNIHSEFSLIKGIPNSFLMDTITHYPLHFLNSKENLFDKVHTLEIKPKSLYSFELENQNSISYPSLRNLIVTTNVGESVNPQNGEEITNNILKSHIGQIERLELNYNFSGLSSDGADLEKDLIDTSLLNIASKSTFIKKASINIKSLNSISAIDILYSNYINSSSVKDKVSVELNIAFSKSCRESGEQLSLSTIPLIKSIEMHYPENDFIFKHSAEHYSNLEFLTINLTNSNISPLTSPNENNLSKNLTGGPSSPQSPISTYLMLLLKSKKINNLNKLSFKANKISLINQLLQQCSIENNNCIKTLEIELDLDTSTIYYDHMSIISGDYFANDLNQLLLILEKNHSIENLIITYTTNHNFNQMIFMEKDHWNKVTQIGKTFKAKRLKSLNLFGRSLKA
ncbi:hypothetical protein DICPUDRAFT_96865 [Dictyostelium purpureum]|uniref:Uncharacterized protein n=1 Tax=Dictyostelium purpureum TaxID=5786 RepID=F0ZBV1_DICPU|nr:uncharacterized protein DICPUDRAFT_96865 [Dictyostelium purpureum]EGC38616.1 hypothetical protein DICPUDRAFT_96865 [Dictyostelium purpureum]|eukprot:XP_003284895.1 hypothetical protein DICPUDRAFT_96865 [Dictyostelium purpureum]